VTRQGGVTSIVKDGVNGLFVRPRNAKEIADKVNRLLANDKLREKMAKNAYESVLTKFSWEKVAQRFFNLYLRSIPKPKKSSAQNLKSSQTNKAYVRNATNI
jgi:glycosyltransferase involved in cell wall biosynthesis